MRDDESHDSPDSGTPVGHDRRPGPDRWRRINGAHHDGPYRTNGAHHELPVRPLPVDDVDEPVDLVAMQADDELLSALASGLGVSAPGRGGYDSDDKLVAMLAAWREEVDADPVPDLVDTDTAVAAVTSARKAGGPAGRAGRRTGGRVRYLVPVAAAACMVVMSTAGVAAANVDSPDDLAYAIVKVVDSERAESIQAKADVEDGLEKVRTALASGDTSAAAAEMTRLQDKLPTVRPDEGQTLLVQEQQYLEAKLQETPPGVPANLTTPPASDPTLLSTAAGTPPPSPTSGTTSTTATPPPGSSAGVPGAGAGTSGTEQPGSSTPGSQASQPDPDDPDRVLPGPTAEPDESSPAPSSPSSPAPGPTSAPASPPDPGTAPGDDPAPSEVPPRGPSAGGGAATSPSTDTASDSAGADVQTTVTSTATN